MDTAGNQSRAGGDSLRDGPVPPEAATFQAIMPDARTSLPGGGSGAFNESLNAVVETLTLVHTRIGADIDDHGTTSIF